MKMEMWGNMLPYFLLLPLEGSAASVWRDNRGEFSVSGHKFAVGESEASPCSIILTSPYFTASLWILALLLAVICRETSGIPVLSQCSLNIYIILM